MTFWQENYIFVKDVYNMRQTKMLEWMDNVEKAIARIMADKVYTSAEFKRERDNFNALCKDLERTDVKKWLQQILEILMAERSKEERADQHAKLEELIKRHEALIPTIMKTQVKVDLYWRCYAYGDELKPHIEFLDSIMNSSTRDIAPSCVENVEELIERQEKALNQLETKRNVVNELIAKGKALLENPDKPRFLDEHVARIENGWDTTKDKAATRLAFLNQTKNAWEGYGEGQDQIALQIEKANEEMKKIKKRFNLDSALEDLEKRQQIFNETKAKIEQMYKEIKENYEVMTMTLPDDKKDFVKKEMKALSEKLECMTKFEEKVKKIEEFVANLGHFDKGIKNLDEWKDKATQQLTDIKEASDAMTPEDRVSYTMELQEDVDAKVDIVNQLLADEEALLPQGDKVPSEAQEYKDNLRRVRDVITALQKKVAEECDNFAEDVKFWAEYKMGVTQFRPWLEKAEQRAQEGLKKPASLEEADGILQGVVDFKKSCQHNLNILDEASKAASKMTSHKAADEEVAELRERFAGVTGKSDEWVNKMDTLVKEWKLLDNTVSELNNYVADERQENEQKFSLEKMESTLGELKSIFKEKEKLVENL